MKTETPEYYERSEEYDSIEKCISFLERIIIECEPNQGCVKCDDTRKIVVYLKSQVTAIHPQSSERENN
jgi:hypothetical protein